MKLDKTNLPFLKGKKIYLREFLKKDINKDYLQWINSKENNFFLETGKFPVNYKDLENYYLKNINSKNAILFAICDNKNRHIGNCSISQIDWINRRCTYGRLIGKKNVAKGAGTEVLKLLQKFVFEELNLNSMWTGVCKNNISSIKSNLKAGMIKTGFFKEAFFKSSKYYDVEIFSITKKQFLKTK